MHVFGINGDIGLGHGGDVSTSLAQEFHGVFEQEVTVD
jgi:hypothetical protein